MSQTRRVAFVACCHTMTTSANRWPDAYEHDRERDAFMPAFAAAGLDLVEVDWEQIDPAAEDFDLYFIRTAWNYKEKPDAFMAFLERAQAYAPVVNDPELVRWNTNKRYLAELAGLGLPVIPSAFVDAEGTTVDDLRAQLGAREIVLKPLVGGGGFEMAWVKPEDDGSVIVPPTQFAQPFMPGIQDKGEISFVFVEHMFSHALRKLPAEGGYLIHTHHGGRNEAYHPSEAEIAAARAFLCVRPQTPLASRVDVVPHDGQLMLMELEVIETHLFPEYNSQLGRLLAEACWRVIRAA